MNFSEQLEMPKHNLQRLFPYSTTHVAAIMPNSKVTGNINLRKFLREQNIFDGDFPLQEYIDCGYFYIEPRCYGYNIWGHVIKVSTAGLIFIRNLVIEKLGIEEIKLKTKRNTKTRK